MKELSVIIVSCGRESLLKRAIDSIKAELYPHLDSEILVIENSDRSMLPGEARNVALSEAQGNWVLFLDDDAYLPSGFGRNLKDRLLRFPDATVMGGPNITPPDSSPFEVAVGLTLSTKVGAFFSSRRYCGGSDHDRFALPCGEESLMLCNLLVRRKFLNSTSIQFDAGLVCAEENDLIRRISRAGGKIYFDPALYVFHSRRGSLSELARQVFKYGRGRFQVFLRDRNSLKFAHLVPALCVAIGVVEIFRLDQIGLSLFGMYALLCVWVSVGAGVRAIWILPAIHISYGLGLWTEALSWLYYRIIGNIGFSGTKSESIVIKNGY